MKAVDTSVAVPALAEWHEAHVRARRVAAGAAIAAHARIETYSVLTRLPPPRRHAPRLVTDVLDRVFPEEVILVPSDGLVRTLVERCAAPGIVGAAVYDALVALTAAEVGASLLTRDQRAARTYERLRIDFELLP